MKSYLNSFNLVKNLWNNLKVGTVNLDNTDYSNLSYKAILKNFFQDNLVPASKLLLNKLSWQFGFEGKDVSPMGDLLQKSMQSSEHKITEQDGKINVEARDVSVVKHDESVDITRTIYPSKDHSSMDMHTITLKEDGKNIHFSYEMKANPTVNLVDIDSNSMDAYKINGELPNAEDFAKAALEDEMLNPSKNPNVCSGYISKEMLAGLDQDSTLDAQSAQCIEMIQNSWPEHNDFVHVAQTDSFAPFTDIQ